MVAQIGYQDIGWWGRAGILSMVEFAQIWRCLVFYRYLGNFEIFGQWLPRWWVRTGGAGQVALAGRRCARSIPLTSQQQEHQCQSTNISASLLLSLKIALNSRKQSKEAAN